MPAFVPPSSPSSSIGIDKSKIPDEQEQRRTGKSTRATTNNGDVDVRMST